MWENISSFIAIIGSLIAICTTIYKKIFKNGFKREQEYYKNVLQPYVEQDKSRNANALQEIIIQIKRTDEYIPKYIWYLIDEFQNRTNNVTNNATNNITSNEDLHKVLIYDYLDIYPNDDNMMGRLAGIFTKILTFIIIFLAFTFLVSGSLHFATVINNLFLVGLGQIDLSTINITNGHELLLSLVCFGLYIATICIAMFINRDRYTTKKKKIKRMISRKVKVYDKRIKNYVY